MKYHIPPKIKSFFAWLHQNLRILIILGLLITCIVILMVRGHGFLEAVSGSYILVSYFSGWPQTSEPLPALIALAVVVAIIGMVVYSIVKHNSKK